MVFRGPTYDTGALVELEYRIGPPTAEDLERIAPLLSHPDVKMRERASRIFTGAPPEVLGAAARTGRIVDERALRIAEHHWVEHRPDEAVPVLLNRMRDASGERRDELLRRLADTRAPEAAPYVGVVIEGAPNTTISADMLDALARNPFLHTPENRRLAEGIVNDPNRSQRDRSHALRALNAMLGRPYAPGAVPN